MIPYAKHNKWDVAVHRHTRYYHRLSLCVCMCVMCMLLFYRSFVCSVNDAWHLGLIPFNSNFFEFTIIYWVLTIANVTYNSNFARISNAGFNGSSFNWNVYSIETIICFFDNLTSLYENNAVWKLNWGEANLLRLKFILPNCPR